MAYADTNSLSISPTALKIRATQPSLINAPFTVTNQGKEVRDIQLQTRFFRDAGSDDGTITYIDQNDSKDMKNYQDFAKKVTIVDPKYPDTSITSLSLGPQQKKQLYLQIEVSKEELPSDHYFSIILLTNATPLNDTADNKSSSSTIQTGIALHVLLSVGTQNAEASIANFSVPFYIETGPVPFTLRIANVGRQFVTPKGTILIKNMFGQTIGRVDLAPSSILSSSIRKIPDLAQYTKPSSNQKDSPTQALWPEKFLLGFYTATLSLTLSPLTNVSVKTVHFIAFPLHFLIGLIIAVIILIVVLVRIRKRLS